MRRISLFGLCLLAALALACTARANVSSKLYDLSFSAPKKVARGGHGRLSVKITPKNGGEIHGGAPAKLKLSSTTQLKLAKETLGNADMKLQGGNASFEVPFTAVSRGRAKIDGDLSFFICTAKSCARQEWKLSTPVRVR